MMDDKERRIVAEMAYKAAVQLHVNGCGFDRETLYETARLIANDVIKIAGGPSIGQAGGSTPQRSPSTEGIRPSPSPSVPSCPKCNEPMEHNPKWTGLGDQPGHKKTESIKWRCSMRGRFVPDKGWSGCDGVKWEDAAA